MPESRTVPGADSSIEQTLSSGRHTVRGMSRQPIYSSGGFLSRLTVFPTEVEVQMRFGPIPLGSNSYVIRQISSVEVVPMQTTVVLVMANGQRNELPASSPDAARAAILQAIATA
jgi:hypothetical protein